MQILREYIRDTVRGDYRPLFDEIKLRSERLDNFLEKPCDLTYTFPKLNEIIGGALAGFIQKHHEDLFSIVDSFQKNIFPKYEELARLRTKTQQRIFQSWFAYLKATLLRENSEGIASDLITTITPSNVLADLLNERYIHASNKINICIQDRMSHISDKYTVESMRSIREQEKNIDKISQKLIEMAKPEIENLLKYNFSFRHFSIFILCS